MHLNIKSTDTLAMCLFIITNSIEKQSLPLEKKINKKVLVTVELNLKDITWHVV